MIKAHIHACITNDQMKSPMEKNTCKILPFSKFRGLMPKKLPFFLDLANTRIPFKNVPFFVKMVQALVGGGGGGGGQRWQEIILWTPIRHLIPCPHCYGTKCLIWVRWKNWPRYTWTALYRIHSTFIRFAAYTSGLVDRQSSMDI